MLRIIDKKSFFNIERVIFPNGRVYDSKCDLIRYMRFKEERTDLKFGIKNIAFTYITDLTREIDDIFSDFSKTIKYEIRRAEKEEININFYCTNDLKNNKKVLEDFRETYMHFCDICQNEDLKKVFDGDLIAKYINNNCVLLSCAQFAGGKIYHMYFFDDKNTVLWYSASDFRNENVDRNLAARANKLLHFVDMKHFKNNGIECYDWGNVSTRNNENPNGIDKFKASFGGSYSEVYSYTEGNTFLGKFLLILKKHIHK